MRIKVLPDTVINQIAAGEVVERPASVVRELVDNAVDAGATDIFVALEGGGLSRMRVRDNGCGMTRDEAILAFERHATSKVSAIDDLWHLHTMGFRGEALASIAAVAKVTLTTRSRDDGGSASDVSAGSLPESSVGTVVTFRGGRLVDVKATPWSEGTEIEVDHLFFNTPARRKFLKSPRSELARIRTWIAHTALARPEIRYRLIADGDEVLNLPRVATVAERARQVFGDGFLRVELVEGDFSVQGMVSHPGEALSDATGFVIVVNGRVVSDRVISRAVREGYDSMLKDREYPTGYLLLELPPEYVDVNVHPQKSEVRFRHSDQVFAVVRAAVLQAIRRVRAPRPGAPMVGGESSDQSGAASVAPAASPSPSAWHGTSAGTRAADAYPEQLPSQREVGMAMREEPVPAPPTDAPFRAFLQGAHQEHLFRSPPSRDQGFRFSDLRYIGQLLQCYLLCELDDAFVIVDMHAAHERVNYNILREARSRHTLTVQRLLLPERVRLTGEQVVVLLEQQELLESLAFEIATVDHEIVEITGVPSVIGQGGAISLLKELAAEPLVAGWRERLEERIDHITARLACHASVRSGDTLTPAGAYALFAQLDKAETAGACPHGRPVVARFARPVVEQWFGRDK